MQKNRTLEIEKVSTDFSVANQLVIEDLRAIKTADFQVVICNRPDKEGKDQPSFAEIETAASEFGIKTIYQPVVSGSQTQIDVKKLKEHLLEHTGPILAYCRTGTRAKKLWQAAQNQ